MTCVKVGLVTAVCLLDSERSTEKRISVLCVNLAYAKCSFAEVLNADCSCSSFKNIDCHILRLYISCGSLCFGKCIGNCRIKVIPYNLTCAVACSFVCFAVRTCQLKDCTLQGIAHTVNLVYNKSAVRRCNGVPFHCTCAGHRSIHRVCDYKALFCVCLVVGKVYIELCYCCICVEGNVSAFGSVSYGNTYLEIACIFRAVLIHIGESVVRSRNCPISLT